MIQRKAFKPIHVASVSSGKDSQATMILMLEHVGRENCRFVFADTGNEDAAVFKHLDYLRAALDIKIDVVKANFNEEIAGKRMFIARDQRTGRRNGKKLRWSNKAKRRALSVLHPTGNPYLDLCLWKGRFPSRKAQFCTQELKTLPLVEYQLSLIEQGYSVVSWQGVRRDESHNRRNAKKIERMNPHLWAFRPIVDWTAQQTINYSLERGLQVNHLYAEGFDRVGCMPCINCGKKEISNIALRKPEEIVRLAEWERLVGLASKRGMSTFFPNPHRDDDKDKAGIYKMVEWSKTTYGGKQYSLLTQLDEPTSCSSAYGLCE